MLRSYSTPVDEVEQVSDEDVHTSANPYCNDLNCWCHINISYHAEVTELDARAINEEEYETALSFFGL